MDAVVLAARPNTGKLAETSSEPLEANIEIAGRPMVSYVLSSLLDLPEISRVLLVGPQDGLSRYRGDRVDIIEPAEDLFANVKLGLSRAETEFVLVSSSDIPLITAAIVKDFIATCLASGADFCYPISRKEDCEAKYPGVKRTYVKVKDGVFTGGNLFFVRKSIVERAWPTAERMIALRKSPLKMASLLGAGLLLKVVLGVAGVKEIEDRVASLLSIRPKAIVGAPPEIGVDVDKPSDLELCRRVLRK